MVLDRGADNLIGRNPNEQGRDHTAQPDGSHESRPGQKKPPVAVDVAGRLGDDSGHLRLDLCRSRVRLDDRGSAAAGESRGAGAHRSGISADPAKPTGTAFAHSVADFSSSRHGYGGSACAAFVSAPQHRTLNFGPNRNRDREPNTHRNCCADGNGDRYFHSLPDSNFLAYSFINANSISHPNRDSHADDDAHSNRNLPLDLHRDQRAAADNYVDLIPGPQRYPSAERNARSELQPIREQRI